MCTRFIKSTRGVIDAEIGVKAAIAKRWQRLDFDQGCQMVYFQTKHSHWGKFWSGLDWIILKYFMSICNLLRTLGIFNDHFVHFVFIWYILSGIGIMYQEKSGNPALDTARIYANRAMVYFGQFWENNKGSPNFWATISMVKIMHLFF
jgi:hypothetical protein